MKNIIIVGNKYDLEAKRVVSELEIRQARWLTASGLFDNLARADDGRRRDALTLLDPEGMGEEIRVLVQGREVDLEALFDREILG